MAEPTSNESKLQLHPPMSSNPSGDKPSRERASDTTSGDAAHGGETDPPSNETTRGSPEFFGGSNNQWPQGGQKLRSNARRDALTTLLNALRATLPLAFFGT
jgi:hypothetical protein